MSVKIYENHGMDTRYNEKDICPTITSNYGSVPLVLGSAQSNAAVLSDNTAPTLTSAMGDGGGHIPMVLMDQGGGVMSVEYGKVGTLRAQTHGHEPLVLQEVYRISSDASNGMRSKNPNTGFKKVDISPTIDTIDPSPSKAQGGIAIVQAVPENNNDHKEPYMLQGNMVGRNDNVGPQGKGYREKTAFTLNATDVQCVAQSRVRKLTPCECERLQGFPSDYTRIPYRGKSEEECPDSPRYKAIGNSWAVPCVRWIGKRIQKHIEDQEEL